MTEDITNTSEAIIEKVPKKRGRKAKKKGYFREEEEQAFREYLACEDEREKNRIFEKKIYPALCKMIECIIRRYRLFTVDESYEDTFYSTLAFLTTKLKNFNPTKKCKAYSYCGTICKHHLMSEREKSIKNRNKCLSYGLVYSDPEKDCRVEDEETYNNFNANLIDKTRQEIQAVLNSKKNTQRPLTENEIKVGNALLQILDNWEDMIEDSNSNKFVKRSMLYFIKEYTLCSTTEIRNAMKMYKNLYLFTKQGMLRL